MTVRRSGIKTCLSVSNSPLFPKIALRVQDDESYYYWWKWIIHQLFYVYIWYINTYYNIWYIYILYIYVFHITWHSIHSLYITWLAFVSIPSSYLSWYSGSSYLGKTLCCQGYLWSAHHWAEACAIPGNPTRRRDDRTAGGVRIDVLELFRYQKTWKCVKVAVS